MRYFILIIFLLSLFSCKEPQNTEIFDLKTPGVFITNEGNFTYGNSSLSYIDFEADTIFNNVFYKTSGYPLGDIAQSISVLDSNIFIVINNSGKIYVINKFTGNYTATINKLTSPRFIQIISNQKAYVTDLYSNSITIFNPTTFEKTGTINAECNTEAIKIIGDFAFVTNWNKGNKLLKIDTKNDNIVNQIKITKQPNSIVSDKNFNLWILCDGGQETDTSLNDFPALICINPDNLQILKTIKFPDKSSSPSHLNINSSGDSIFFIYSSWNGNITDGGIYKMAVEDSLIPKNPLIKQNNRIFYSMAVNNKSQIIVSDAIDYIQPGIILFYSSNGILLKKYNAGIIPGCFLFNE